MILEAAFSLEACADAILDRWARHVRNATGGRTRHGVTIRRAKANMRPLLRTVIAAAGDRQALRSFDAERPGYLEARHFGELRQQQGFRIEEVLEEFRQLRREVVSQIVDVHAEDVLDQIQRADDAVDRAQAIAIETFHAIEVETLTELVALDPLTGLYDYGHLWERLEQEVQRSKRHGRPLSIIMLDIDWFKRYNDHYGHLWGDIALKEISAILQAISRRSDVVARYGGDEFLIILPETSLEGAASIGERAREMVSEHPFKGKTEEMVAMTVSVGCATTFDGQIGARDMVARADGALYEAKHRGKNRVVLFEEGMPCLVP
ncbi:MAG TPA: diguanylate cyclase [Chloroflexota bacterium]